MTSRCNSTSYKKRLFSDYLTSLNEQPVEELSQLEKHSPIFISYHENPVVFDNNVFEQNVGLFGGAISFDTPNYANSNFEGASVYANKLYRPFIIIDNNTFRWNQAYLTGNAVHVRSTR